MMPEDPYAYAQPLPEFVPVPVYLEFIPPKDEILLAEEQPLPAADSPTADSLRYILECDPEKDLTDYPVNGGDDNDDDDGSSDDDEDDDDDEDEDKDDEEKEEEHLVPADSIPPPPVHHVNARMSSREQPPTPVWSEEEIDKLLSIPLPPPSPLSPWSSPLPQIPSQPLPVSLPLHVSFPLLPASPTYPLGYRAAMIWLRAETPSTSHPPPPITPPSRTPPLLLIPFPTSSPPLLLPSMSHRADVPEVTLPPWKRLYIALGLRFDVGESSSAPTARPTKGFRADYGFVATLDDEIRRDLEREVAVTHYAHHDELLITGFNAPGTSYSVATRFGGATDWFPVMSSDNASSAVTYTSIYSDSDGPSWGIPLMDTSELSEMDPHEELTVESLGYIAESDSMEEDSIDYPDEPEDDDEDLEEDPEENHTDYPADGGDGDDEPFDDDDDDDDDTNNEDEEPTEDEDDNKEDEEHLALTDSSAITVVDPVTSSGDTEAFETDESAPTPRSPQTRNSHIMNVGLDVSYAINWTNLRKKMTYKYCPRDEIKKLEVELWNLKVKGTDVVSYNQRIQELTLKCAKMFIEESDKIERYISGLADMIHGSIMASKPKTMQDVIEFTTKLMDKKINTFAERQAEKKRKFKDTLKNNQNQQQNKRQNTSRATLQDLLIRNLTEVLSHYALNATITMILSVLQNATSAIGLAIWLVTIGVLQVPILLTTKRVLGQFRSLHALSVEPRDIQNGVSNQGSENHLNIISCAKTQKYMLEACYVFLAHVTTKESEDMSEKKRLEEVPIVRDFPEVFPKDFSGLPPTRQVEFRIDLILGVVK
nr:reverse transcriptase domain-containing protein [Tanacetum cinerariifolium]